MFSVQFRSQPRYEVQTTHAPHSLRLCVCVSPPHTQNSLTRSAPLNSEAQGRSGARFHTSYDKRYVIKTISSEDVAEMHNILKKYHQVCAVAAPVA